MIRSHVELDRTPGTLEETSTFQTASAVSPVICSEGSGKMQGNEVDGASLCSSPSSFRVRLKNTFLDFKEEADMLRIEVESTRSRAPSADFLVHSPLRRSQSDVTGVDDNIRLRLGSNAGIADDTIELDGESFSPAGRLSPMSCLASRSRGCGEKPVSILSFSPPTFRSSPFSDAGNNKCTDFVMIMEEDPQVPSRSRISELSLLADPSCHSTQPNTPTVCISAGPAGDTGIDERTTVMLRNIPNKYTQRMLLTEVNSLGFEGQYDFFYLPIDYRNKCNVGYGFISFTSNSFAQKFISRLHGYRLPGFNSQKICEVSWARVQGLRANIQHYRNSPVNSINIPEYRPLLFAHGTEIQFPFVNSKAH